MNGTIQLRVLDFLIGEKKINLEVSESYDIFLPKSGVLPNDPTLGISVNSSLGNVPFESFRKSPGIGIRETSLAFSPNKVGMPTEITTGFFLYCNLVHGDTIHLKLPGFGGSDIDSLYLSGDEAARSFVSQFDGSWDSASSTLSLRVSNTTVLAGQRYIYIAQNNSISLPASVSAAAPPMIRINSHCSGKSKDIEVASWTNVGIVSVSEISYGSRTAGSPTSISLKLNVSHKIYPGDSIEINFPGFEAPNSAKVELRGKSAAPFTGSWSQGDHAIPLNISSGKILPHSDSIFSAVLQIRHNY